MTTGVTAHQLNGLELAVIGMAGRFPGAATLDAFWRNVRDGIESVSVLSEAALLAAGVDDSMLRDPQYVRARAVLDDIDLFDAAFFGFTPREADCLDPQHRLFLESAWEALEQAGYDADRYEGTIGVYGGASLSGYLFHLVPDRYLLQSPSDMAAMLAADKDFLTTRVSYKLNLEGPSLTVQTACSTSLVAVHLACQGLLSGECDMALAGGVSVSVPQQVGYLYQEGGITSPDGHCRTFDAKAQGTVGGSGVGVIVLKRVHDALAAGDRIVALIKGSAVNNDGASKVGYTAPRIEGQAKVIRAAQAVADVDPQSIGYVEAHGTATPMGDPIEIAALTQAFRSGTADQRFCAVGSVKPNIGHLDAAAGIAGLIKTVLALEHKVIPPSLHFTQPNPQIDFETSPFFVNEAPAEWRAGESPRRAGVSSFGIGGTNAHVVLEEAPEREPPGPSRPWHVLVWSAKTASALDAMTDRLAAHFREQKEDHLADEAFTLQAGRKAFPHRRMVLCRTRKEAAEWLGSAGREPVLTGGPVTTERAVLFMFSGQGTQYVNMGRELYDSEAIFREQVDHCAHVLRPALGLDLRRLLYPADEQTDQAREQLNQTAFTQPALFVIEYALAKLWMAWGVRPRAMIGHSIGEYVAACLAGVLSLADALELVALRGRLMQQQPPGTMLAVPLSEDEIVRYLGQRLSLAAVNAPSQCVVSGPSDEIAQLERMLAAQGVEGRRLQTSHAFHSGMMDAILDPFEHRVRTITRRAPGIPYISNVTGTWITGADIDEPRYWSRHLRDTVRFADGIRALGRQSDQVLLEVGPGHTLATLAAQGLDQSKPLCSLRRPQGERVNGSETAGLLNALGSLWMAGVPIDWDGLHAGERRRRVPMPTYPFERRRYWFDRPSQAPGPKDRQQPPGRQPDLAEWFYVPSWKRSVLPLDGSPSLSASSCWLVLLDDCSIGQNLIRRLEGDGRMVATVAIGERFQRLGDGTYSLRPGHRDDYDALREALERDGRQPDVILHGWSLREGICPPGDVFEQAQMRGFYSLLFLAQAFAGLRRLTIVALSNGLHDVTGQEVLRPEQATLLGACRVIPQEYPEVACRSIDVDFGSAGMEDRTRWSDRIVKEAETAAPESTVAYRGLHRWVQVFDSMKFSACGREQPLLLRRRGVYLVTGGLGGVGLALADYLARTVEARLILTGRSEPAPDTRRRVEELERCGAEVMVMQADVADALQMQAVLDRARARFGEIHGVVHAAGIPGGGLIELKTLEATAKEFAPKANGALVLDALFREQPPDFLLFCSSLNAVTGGFGQVAYCAANAFLDAFAHFRASKGASYTLSINSDRWRQIGMAVEAEARLKSWGIDESDRGMTVDEGQEVVHRLLSQSAFPQVVVSTRPFPPPAEETEAKQTAAVLKTAKRAATMGRPHVRPASLGPYAAPATAVEAQLAAIWEQVFGMEGIGRQDDFFELGGESLLALQVVNRIRDSFGVDVSLRQFFDQPSVAGIAAMVACNPNGDREAEDAIVPRTREARRAPQPASGTTPLPVEGASR